ncbi:MAG: Glu/Leu/Phe/Val dehydrogenase [Pseudomonadales bacterium]|nr:Glu/Leu/Phe/Val dehydrogenase [Pseudomonadales bacterium]
MQDSFCADHPVDSHHDIFCLSQTLPLHDLHFWQDKDTQLQAIIAIDNTDLGPALGGCRFVSYPSTQAAIEDALRLAHSMSLKSAVHQVPFGGGKAVILKPQHKHNRAALFQAFGRFVESLNGRYITAMDSGTTIEDMNNIAQFTSHVVCTSIPEGDKNTGTGDPSPYTAEGVFHGIRAALKVRLKREDLDGIHIAIQGAGHVGFHLAQRLLAEGANVTVADINAQALENIQDELGVACIGVNDIYQLPCDVFSPCALGQSINQKNIKQLQTKIIAGSANNQIDGEDCLKSLNEKNILYAPDFVINAGGILQIAYLNNPAALQKKLAGIYDNLLDIFTQATDQQCSTLEIAQHKAYAVLAQAKKTY